MKIFNYVNQTIEENSVKLMYSIIKQYYNFNCIIFHFTLFYESALILLLVITNFIKKEISIKHKSTPLALAII